MLEPGKYTDVFGFVDDGLDTQCPPFLQILLDTAVLVGKSIRTSVPGLKILVPKGALVLRPRRSRPKMAWTSWVARCRRCPEPGTQRPLARRGSSKTKVRETSTWRIDSSQK